MDDGGVDRGYDGELDDEERVIAWVVTNGHFKDIGTFSFPFSLSPDEEKMIFDFNMLF